MLAILYSRATNGIHAPLVTVEIHLSNGLPQFHIVGLPAVAVKESKERVRSAILTNHFKFTARRITANLAPADLPKDGGRFDLPIALGILAASKQLPSSRLDEYEFAGELALSGELREIRGVLPMVLAAKKAGRKVIVPSQNAEEAALVQDVEIFAAQHLAQVCAHLQGSELLPAYIAKKTTDAFPTFPDLADVKGQYHAKRALELAAAGRHSILLMGPPGTGKTMLATRLPGLLPELAEGECLEIAAISSVSNAGFNVAHWKQIPFRSPHHSSSSAALVGGGRPPKPGEISLAHHGVLFLDELPEFHRTVLEGLREPLESGTITISRAAWQTIFPANFQLVAAMNPCPCGYAGTSQDQCICRPDQIQKYISKLSGPLLDRIDMQVGVSKVTTTELNQHTVAQEKSDSVKLRIQHARQAQWDRQQKLNSSLTIKEIERFIMLTEDAKKLIAKIMNRFNLSARAYHRVLKVAQTISDLDGQEKISVKEISEAISFRFLENLDK